MLSRIIYLPNNHYGRTRYPYLPNNNWKKQSRINKTNSESAGIARIAKKSEIGTNHWCVSSGARSHIKFDLSIFVEHEDFNSTVGKAKSNVKFSVVGLGKNRYSINVQSTIFKGISHIPELHLYLLSLRKLTSGGHSANLEAKKVTTYLENRIIVSGPKICDKCVLRTHWTEDQERKVDLA